MRKCSVFVALGLGLCGMGCDSKPQRITIHLSPLPTGTHTSTLMASDRSTKTIQAATPTAMTSIPSEIPVAYPRAAPALPTEAGRPGVPPEIQKDFEPDAPIERLQLALKRTRNARRDWDTRRALIEDLLSSEVRSYAIGDLLPRGAVLVGIQPRLIRVMTRNSLVLQLEVHRDPIQVKDLRIGRAPTNKLRRSTVSDVLKATVFSAVEDLSHQDGHLVIRAVDKLVREGQPIAPLLAEHAASTEPVQVARTRIGTRRIRSNTRGQRVIAILEHITGQSFGDPTDEGAQEDVAQAWEDWAGL